VTEIRESPKKLRDFVCDMRRDWTPEETWVALLACKTAGFEWAKIARGLVDLALADEPTPTRPRDLYAAVRGISRTRAIPVPFDPGLKEQVLGRLAAATAATDAIRSGTGPQPALTEGHDP
jgi:hypothetical protein